MARWRPAAEKSSPYITAEGYKRLEAEYKSIWEKRTEVTAALTAAAAEGDRSENAEYIYRKKQLREIDRRITYLQKRMPILKVVTTINDNGYIYFGCIVTIEDDNTSEILKYRIVGADEIDHQKNYISVDAPLAKALLGKTTDDTVSIIINKQTKEFTILNIETDN